MSSKLLTPENYISSIQNGEVRIEGITPQLVERLNSLGLHGLYSYGELILKAADEATLSKLLAQLRDLDVLFGGGSGWPPAEIFDDLRERGLVQGKFIEITWRGPSQWITRTR